MPYGGIREDALVIKDAVHNPVLFVPATLLAIADMPLSFVADTVRLPKTLSEREERQRQREEAAEARQRVRDAQAGAKSSDLQR
jgi:uncharacterized protein YceK